MWRTETGEGLLKAAALAASNFAPLGFLDAASGCGFWAFGILGF